jgi:molecular chaperone GrpE
VPERLESEERLDSVPSRVKSEVPETADSPGGPPDIASVIVLPAEVGSAEVHEQKARLAEARLAQVLDAYRQIKADQEAFKERTARSLARRFDGRHERLLLKFIDILDNFDRALEASEQTYAGQPLIEGLILVRTQLLQTLQQEGLERIPVLGLPFDPHVSEAMSSETVEDPEQDGLVVKEYQRGYRINGRLARPSRVVVGRHAEAAAVAAVSRETQEQHEPQEVQEAQEAPAAEPAPALAAYDSPEPLRPIEEDEADETPCAATTEDKVSPTPVDEEGPTLEEIIAHAEARRVLFGEAFEDESQPGTDDEEPEP